jgi:hypothetical protein
VLGYAIAAALVLALVAAARRQWRRRRIAAIAASLPGATAALAIPLEDVGDIDFALRSRRCICGGVLASLGERSERADARVLRVVRAECNRCEREQSVYFDPSIRLH